MTNKNNIEVIKAQNQNKTTPPSRNFPEMPQLYLELLENKEKIKPTVVNTDYIHDNRSEISEILSVVGGGNRQQSFKPSSSLKKRKEESEEEDEEEEDEEDDEDEYEEVTDDEDDEEEDDEDDDEEDEEDDEEDDEDDDDDRPRKSKMPVPTPITNKLYNLLAEDKPSVETFGAPKLSELEQSGQIHRDREIPDFTQYAGGDRPISNEDEDDLKREILFKFELLKKSYKNVPIDIPEFTMHSDYNNMKRVYDNTVRRVSLDASVESYKTYLIGGFMVMEFILGHWLKFDMQGFTQQQILNMSTYDRLLIELGEKNYVPQGSEWPVELRLMFMIIINAGVFIVSKLILKRTGTNFMSMMNSMNDFNKTTNNSTKRKMRGPNIDLDNIPDIDVDINI